MKENVPLQNKLLWVKTIYLYVVSIVALIILCIGVYRVVDFATRKFVFGKYVMDFYEEERCMNMPTYIPSSDGSTKSMTDAQAKEQKDTCQKSLEQSRKYREVLDLTGSLTTLLLGSGLYYSHFVYLRKKWEGEK